jgi:hypothetical protein
MPAGAVADPPWLTGTWSDTAWEENTWGLTAQAAILGDLTTIFTGYVEDLADTALDARPDYDSLIAEDLPTVRASTTDRDDLNTMYAIYISS